jgi:arginase
VLDGELPTGEVALEGEIGDAHPGMMTRRRQTRRWWPILATMTNRSPIAIVGSPTALGGHFAGMERTPDVLRQAGLAARLAAAPALDGVIWTDPGDVPNDPGWASDPDPRARNRDLLCRYLPRLADQVASAMASTGTGPPPTRLLLLGGDCTSHAGALAGLCRARPGLRLGLVWFDAHGDFNTPSTTPSGNVWGMPFAMACGRGDADLVAAVDGPTVREADAGLVGGQVLDEAESRMLSSSEVAHFGAGMISAEAGMACFEAWASVIAARVDAWYVAFDLDAIDADVGLAVAMPETGGLALGTAIDLIRVIASSGPVIGLGVTAAMVAPGQDPSPTVDAIVALAGAALG